MSLEVYPTPLWCVHRLLEAVRIPGGEWLEPCVGEGAIIEAVAEVRDDVQWHTIDIRPGCGADETRSFFQGPAYRGRMFNACVMNPPFSKALQFAEHAIKQCIWVAMLQRLNWLASEERAEWLRAHPPGVYVLPNRPSFVGGGTDNQEYAWFLWPQQHPTVQILGSTPISERKRARQPKPDARQLAIEWEAAQ